MKIGPVGEDRLYNLAHAEAMTWRVDDIPVALSEMNGPLVVKLRGEVVKMFRWFHHPRMVDGVLQVLDVTRGFWVVREYQRGEWDEVIHDWRFAGLY